MLNGSNEVFVDKRKKIEQKLLEIDDSLTPNSATKKIETKLIFFNLDTFTIDFKKNAAIDCFAGEIFGAQKENFGNLQSL